MLAVGIELVAGVVVAERVDRVVAGGKDDQELVWIEDRRSGKRPLGQLLTLSLR